MAPWPSGPRGGCWARNLTARTISRTSRNRRTFPPQREVSPRWGHLLGAFRQQGGVLEAARRPSPRATRGPSGQKV